VERIAAHDAGHETDMINFCYDSLGDNPDLGYPNLAQPALAPDEFDTTWPRVLPLRLLMYLQQFGHHFQSWHVAHAPKGSWYPIALAWHDFECDYLALASHTALARARRGEIKFFFYYHEGDHPGRIQQRFDLLCRQHDLPHDCYLFISANSAADQYPRCYYFNDHEYFLSYINRRQTADWCDRSERPYEFTALNRIHKWWRASIMSDLYHEKVLDHSLWSYNTVLTEDDRPEDNPIRLDARSDWSTKLQQFLSGAPYECDGADAVSHNDHRRINVDLYTKSYCHLVLETLFDVDQSGGTFLTEKTWKCMKFGQPFVIIGPVGSLDILRRSGYRVFDHAIDNAYDTIEDNTDRYLAVRKSIAEIKKQDMHQWYLRCLDDVKYNQWQFHTKANGTLDCLVKKLTEHSYTI
jgi:hypothetical protein